MKLSKSFKNMPPPPRNVALSLYAKMALVRRTEEEIVRRYPEQEMRCPVHLSIGQEAVAAGVCETMEPADILFSTHRCHAHYLSVGGNLDAMIAELYGKASGCCGGKGGSMHLIDAAAGCAASSAIVGGNIPVAVGAALGFRRTGRASRVVLFLGDGAVDEGIFHESMNFAALHKLPVLFAVENNFYATQSPQKNRQALDNIHKRGEPFGIPGRRIDGSNVIEVYNAALEAADYIKRGNGPVLFEFRTYRWYGHVGTSDDAHLCYRPAGELKRARRRCPIRSFRKFALANNLLAENEIAAADSEIEKLVLAAFNFAKAAPFPDAGNLYTNLFEE